MCNGGYVEIVKDKVYGIGGMIELDGSVTWAPHDALGYQPAYCYLMIEQNRAILVDTGMAVHRKEIVQQIVDLSDRFDSLSIFLTRREADSVGNLEEIVHRFDVQKIIGIHTSQNPAAFFPTLDPEMYESVGHGDTIQLTSDRKLTCFAPPLQMLPTLWLYDHETGALFTSDCFTHIQTDENRLQHDNGDNFRAYLLLRFPWVQQVEKKEELLEKLGCIFKNDVRMIAPAHGCVISGKEAVFQNHKHMLDCFQTQTNWL